ncbi:hypothetical protein LTR95_002941 [Oleoguttula sp. CCFEE 5521]
MRLLNIETLKFQQFYSSPPPYVIASHRWAAETEEITLQDVVSGCDKSKAGYKKLEGFIRFAKSQYSEIKWIWIDTCCIDKTNSVELSEAINRMFKWYKAAYVCLAYLQDVTRSPLANANGWEEELRHSEWFTRGWTLQELLAPSTVVFLTRQWKIIGYKGDYPVLKSSITGLALLRHDYVPLESIIASFTKLPKKVLLSSAQLETTDAEDCLQWVNDRNTTREEDKWYCLFGILGTPIGAIYGEEAKWARHRLLARLEEIGSIKKGRAAVLASQSDTAIPQPVKSREPFKSRVEASKSYAQGREGERSEKSRVAAETARLLREMQNLKITIGSWNDNAGSDENSREANMSDVPFDGPSVNVARNRRRRNSDTVPLMRTSSDEKEFRRREARWDPEDRGRYRERAEAYLDSTHATLDRGRDKTSSRSTPAIHTREYPDDYPPEDRAGKKGSRRARDWSTDAVAHLGATAQQPGNTEGDHTDKRAEKNAAQVAAAHDYIRRAQASDSRRKHRDVDGRTPTIREAERIPHRSQLPRVAHSMSPNPAARSLETSFGNPSTPQWAPDSRVNMDPYSTVNFHIESFTSHGSRYEPIGHETFSLLMPRKFERGRAEARRPSPANLVDPPREELKNASTRNERDSSRRQREG